MENGVYQLSTSKGDKVFKGENFKLGEKGKGRGIGFQFCYEPDCLFLHLEYFFDTFLGCTGKDGEAVKEVRVD